MCRSGTSSPKHDNFWTLFRIQLQEEMWINWKFIKWEAAKIDVLLKISIWTPIIFECLPYCIPTEYSESLWHLDKGWDIENTAFFLLEKIDNLGENWRENGQKRDFAPPYWAY